MSVLFGPFDQLVTFQDLPLKGPLKDSQIDIIQNGGIFCQGNVITAIGSYADLTPLAEKLIRIDSPSVAFPGLVDAHTHLCWAGNRAREYALRLQGANYQEIAAQGGGILSTVASTRNASEQQLLNDLLVRLHTLLRQGITTCEIKSGYGLDAATELKILRTIAKASELQPIKLIPTCLAAHTLPPEYSDPADYLKMIENELWPCIIEEKLSSRMDIFVDECAFSPQVAKFYLETAKKRGFQITLHADQFSPGGGILASELNACSADHLECTDYPTALQLAKAGVVAVVLPGATLGLGQPFPPARMLLDSGNCLAIASDWNPGTAPMGRLMTQAALLGAQQRLTLAETWAAITFRAAHALGLDDGSGRLASKARADFIVFPCKEWQEPLYYQGALAPREIFIGGRKC